MARRRSMLVYGAVALLGGTVLLTGLSGVAQASFTFEGVAAADGTEATAANPSIPLGVTLTGAGPSTQARLTSLPTSDAFASFPYPGEALAGAPGVANGVLPVPVFPAYPFIVNSGLGDDPRSRTAPGVSLEAASERLAARSRAVVGTEASGSESTAQVTADPDNGVTALAHSVTRGLEVLDSVSFAVVDSSAKAARDSSGALTRSSSLTFSRLAIPGLAYTLPSNSPAFAGQTISGVEFSLTDGQFYVALPFAGAPKNVPVSTASVIAALKSTGITATYQAPFDTKDGIVGAAFSMATDLPAPPPNGSYDGPTHVTYTVGRSSASVSLNPIPAFDVGGAPPTGASTPTDGGVAAGGDAVGVPNAVPVALPGTAAGAVAPAGLPTVELRPAGATLATGVVPAALSRRAFDSSQISDLYLLIAALGGLGFIALRAIRLRGVRLR